MKQEYLIKALEKLEEEAQSKQIYNTIHKTVEPYLYNMDDKKIKDIAEGKKTYAGMMKEMSDVARKRQQGGVGVVPPDEAELMIKRYFGIDSDKPAEKKAENKTVSIFDL